VIGDQRRPDLFALHITKPLPWYSKVVEVNGRICADGTVLEPLQIKTIHGVAERLVASGIRTAAVALVHSWSNPEHEQRVEAILRSAGFTHISLSHELAPRIKLLSRAQTAVINACLSGVIEPYLREIQSCLGKNSTLEALTSTGGLMDVGSFHPKDSLLSGPAGGVAGAAHAAQDAGFSQTITFDMGGTSTDVSRIEGNRFEYTFSHSVGDAQIMAPALAIESVAAGGGSICQYEHGALSVGPKSAGAEPGPACYGASGPLTVTDVNLLLGRLDPLQFEVPISIESANCAFEKVRTSMGASDTPESILESFLELANEKMAEAIRVISVRQGYDPAAYVLTAFGGAGGQHACGVARRLEMQRVLIPPDASLLSALGLEHSSQERHVERQILHPFDEVAHDIGTLMQELEQEAMRQLGVAHNEVKYTKRCVSLRFTGQDHSVTVDWANETDSLLGAFEDRCRQMYGCVPDGRTIEIESLHVIAKQRSAAHPPRVSPVPETVRDPANTRSIFIQGKWQEVPIINRAQLPIGDRVPGPVLIVESNTATIVEPDWTCCVIASGALELIFVEGHSAPAAAHPRSGQNELLVSGLMSIASEMGTIVKRTSISTNIKERQDYSCAILDEVGDLVASAPHIPVHIGAIGACVKALRNCMNMRDGDIVITNHPAFGGSHLPDVTAIAPVYVDEHLIAHVACRAHHAEIGGLSPGSMPPHATLLSEEGVVFHPMKLFDGGASNWDAVESHLCDGPYPSRSPIDNIADITGAVAALRRGIEGVRTLCKQNCAGAVRTAMRTLVTRTETATRESLAASLGHVQCHAATTEFLEDASDSPPKIEVATQWDGNTLTIDFTGTSRQHAGNLNAPLAVTRSAVMYVIRLMLGELGEGLPLNEGLMSPVRLIVPEGLLNPKFVQNPDFCPAVAAGNVETSQRVVNALVRALGLCAAGQGTMNNVLFGNDRFGYYETLAGGAGAGPGFSGASAVHSHMTNTAITDVEIMEWRYPVRVHKFQIREGSGGSGRWSGGDGLIRELEFIEAVELDVITQNRIRGAIGLNGGKAGKPGYQYVVRADGSRHTLFSIDSCTLNAGDRFVIETPGGGGCG